MSEGLIKSMWTGVLPGVNSALESLSGQVLGPGDSGDDSQEELDGGSEEPGTMLPIILIARSSKHSATMGEEHRQPFAAVAEGGW